MLKDVWPLWPGAVSRRQLPKRGSLLLSQPNHGNRGHKSFQAWVVQSTGIPGQALKTLKLETNSKTENLSYPFLLQTSLLERPKGPNAKTIATLCYQISSEKTTPRQTVPISSSSQTRTSAWDLTYSWGLTSICPNTYSLHCHHKNDSALRWAAVWDILMFH